MEIRGVGGSQGPQEYQRQVETKAQQPKAQEPREDTIQISEEAKRLLSKDASADSPGARKVEETAARLADRLVTSGAVRNPGEAADLSRKVAEKLAGEGASGNPKDLEAVRQRVENGFYSRPAVAEKIADRLLEEMGI